MSSVAQKKELRRVISPSFPSSVHLLAIVGCSKKYCSQILQRMPLQWLALSSPMKLKYLMAQIIVYHCSTTISNATSVWLPFHNKNSNISWSKWLLANDTLAATFFQWPNPVWLHIHQCIWNVYAIHYDASEEKRGRCKSGSVVLFLVLGNKWMFGDIFLSVAYCNNAWFHPHEWISVLEN